jgi:hypothetical protein
MEIDLSHFDKSKPIVIKHDLPDFDKERHPHLAKQKYYEKEDEKYREGVGEYIDVAGSRVRKIPGSLYFSAQNVMLINRQTGRPEPYKARDVDYIFHSHARESFIKKEVAFTVKSRGDGYSSAFAGAFPLWVWRIMPGSTVVMTSSSATTSAKLYNDKLKPALLYCNPDIFNNDWVKNGGDKIKEQTTGNIQLKLRSSFIDYKGKLSDLESTLYVRESSQTDQSPSCFAGSGAYLAFCDELPLHGRAEALLSSVINILQDTNTGLLEGYLICGGVVEATIGTKDLQRLYEIWNKAEERNINRLFIRSSLGKYVDANGFSDEPKYMEYYEKKIAQLSKLEDTSDLIAFQKNNPMSIDDVFSFASNDEFEPDVIELVKEQIHRVRLNPPNVKHGMILNMPDDKGVDHAMFKEKQGGDYFVLEEPKTGIIYDICLDGIATGSNTSQEAGSKAAILVVKGIDPEEPDKSYRVVAGYYARPTSVEISYIAMHRLIERYNIFGGVNKVSAESNASTGEHLSKYMVREGLQKFITWHKGKPFVYVTIDFRTTQFLRANLFLRKRARNIDYLPLLEQIVSPMPMGKKDILAAYLMWILKLNLDFDKPINVEKPVEMREQLRYNEQTKRMERVWIPVQVQTNNPSHQISNY